MCDRCSAMEPKFFEEYWDSRSFSRALAAAMRAGQEFDEQQAAAGVATGTADSLEMTPEEYQALGNALVTGGIGGLVEEYAQRHGNTLDQETSELFTMGRKVVSASLVTHEKHQDKTKTVMEVTSNLLHMTMSAGVQLQTREQVAALGMMLGMFAAVLTDLAACPEAREALERQRGVPEGVQL